jgi:hypothetical protein
MPNELYFEDLYPGMKFESTRAYKVTAEEIKEFAESYDPQPFLWMRGRSRSRSCRGWRHRVVCGLLGGVAVAAKAAAVVGIGADGLDAGALLRPASVQGRLE